VVSCVTGDKNTRHISFCGIRLMDQVASVFHFDPVLEDSGIGDVANGYEETGDRNILLLSGLVIEDADAGDVVIRRTNMWTVGQRLLR